MADPMPWDVFTDSDDDPEPRTFTADLWDTAGPNPERDR